MRYEGPICYLAADVYETRRRWHGRRTTRLLWVGGWHYSTRKDRHGNERPHRRLHLNEDGAPFYELAEKTHRSWLEKHGTGNFVQLRP